MNVTSRTPLAVVLAGPNGAGKSTCAPYLLKRALAVHDFVNADTIAQGLSAYRPETAAVTAGRVMLERLRTLAGLHRDFGFETTLSGRLHARWLREHQAAGYRTHLIFLSLPSADLAVARVADRVRRGGHHVPDTVVRRRFVAGLKNLFAVYMPAVDAWNVYDNADVVSPRLIASRAFGASIVVADAEVWKHLKELQS
jgi:predicted ABC-type ATPase